MVLLEAPISVARKHPKDGEKVLIRHVCISSYISLISCFVCTVMVNHFNNGRKEHDKNGFGLVLDIASF